MDEKARLADQLLNQAATEGRIRIEQGLVARAGFRPSLDRRQAAFRDDLLARYRTAGLAPPATGELPDEVRTNPDLWPVLKMLEREGELVGLDAEFFVDSEALGRARSRVADELGGAKGLGPADFRAVLPVTRKHLIPILSYFDQVGLTLRREGGREVVAPRPAEGATD